MKNLFNRKVRTGIYLLIILLTVFASADIWAGDWKVLHEKTFNTEAGKRLRINTSIGDIYISTWNKPEVYVRISGNEKAREKVDFKFENTGEGVYIKAEKESWFGWFNWNNANMKYEIRVPADYNVQLHTAGGDVKIKDLKGRMNIETSGGDIELRNTTGSSSLATSGGDIKLEFINGDLKGATSGGDINIRNFQGDLSVATSGGDINLEGKNGRVDARTSGGDITLRYSGSNKGITLKTSGGDIKVFVPADFGANADLVTMGGEIDCDIPVTQKGKFSASKLRGAMNGGGESLYCSTSGGDIIVR